MAYGKIKADTIIYDNSGTDVEVTTHSITTKANLADPTFTGTVTVPTPAANDNTTKAATTAYVQTELSDYATLANPTFTGTLTCGDLTVSGTTTTVNSTTMSVADKNIELAKGAANDAAADGGGITLVSGDGNKTITWVNAQDAWVYNQTITVETGVINVKGGEGSSAAVYLISDEGDDNADTWRVYASADNNLYFQNYTTGSYTTTLKLNPNGAVEDSKGDVRAIPQNTQASAYTLVASDHGKHILASGDITVPDNVFTAGQAITIVNNTGGNITINKGTTMYWGVDGSNGNRTLGLRGVATLLVASGTVTYLTGAGLS